MPSHHTLLTIALLTITLLMSAAREAPALQPPAVAPQSQAQRAPPRTSTPTLRLRNASADTLRVEIRVGPGASCANARAADTRLLPPGRTWLIAADQPICWRQAASGTAAIGTAAAGAAAAGTAAAGTAAATARWTPWERRALQTAERAEAALVIPGRLP